ncbi:ABC transporter substrate-binding protein [Nocardioides alcanivorans]|uniref:ABC transporter substrate-binding protein n=1 Tax=Nocardioides alcanivorans TaxID=2897352 RepID=UPI001F1EDB1E|nr:ABC transporter substrate-binding protein [Nocardioides alcanivorans]
MLNRTATRNRVAVAVMAGALLLTGCADSGDDDKDNNSNAGNGGGEMTTDEIYVRGPVNVPADEGTPKDGGTLEVVDYSEARSLDPTKTIPSGAVGGNALAAVYDTLLRYDNVENTYAPLLAESLETDDDTTFTLKLREGATFSDGTPLNAEAVIGSIGYFMENRGFNTALLAGNIKEMKPVDDLTVEFTLNKPWATFPMMLTSGAGMILAPAAIKGGPDKFTPIGAGPFKFESYKPAEELTLVRNDDYFGEKPHLDKIRFTWIQADQAKYEAFQTGNVDVISIRAPKVLEEARRAGHPGYMTPVGNGNTIWINSREGRPGENLKVRQAINAAIDNELYLERTADGAGLPSRNIYSKAFPYYTDIETADYDADLAKKLVEEAKAEGAVTEMQYVGQSDPASQAGAVTVKAMLEDAGFKIELDLVRDVAEQVARLYATNDFDLALGAMSIAEDPYMSLMNNIYSGSPSNPAGYANKEMDALIDELQTKQPLEAIDTLEAINKLWQESIPSVVLAEGGFFSPWQDNIHGIDKSSNDIQLYHDAWKE